MKDLAQVALDEARRAGARYADVRAVERDVEVVAARNDDLLVDRREKRGIAVRALLGGAWGFAATASLTRKAAAQAAREAVAAASASALFAMRPAALAPGTPGPPAYTTSCARDPFQVPVADKAALALAAAAAARRTRDVRVARCRLRFVRDRAFLATSEGFTSERTLRLAGAGVRATTVGRGRTEVRTAPSAGGGVWAGGLEAVERLGLEGLAARVGEEARELLSAAPCPEGAFDVVLDPWLAARLLHETLGHAFEADAPSFVGAKDVGKTRFGSRWLNLVQDAGIEGAAGTIGLDDEGMTPRGVTLVSEGMLTGLLTDREAAKRVGGKSTGSARAAGFREPPRVRMTNLALATGQGDLASLLADLGGLFLAGARGYSVDPRRGTFRIAADVAWEVRAGRRVRMLRGAALGGRTADLWTALDAVAGAEATELAGFWCEKAGQRVAVGHRVAPVRLRKVAVGPVGS